MQNEDAIDAIITWVDGSDPKWQAKKDKLLGREDNSENVSATRYADNDEIYYCLASILKNAPFIRRIHIVTDNQRPDAIDRLTKTFGQAATDKISIVDHTEIFRGYEEYLPTFNSISIESMLHRISGLAEKYIYFNDDVLLLRPSVANDFFCNGKAMLRGEVRTVAPIRVLRLAKSLGSTVFDARILDRVSYKEVQCNAAEILGAVKKFFWHDHTPHPFLKSDIESFFCSHQSLLVSNISHRTRHKSQFLVSALQNNLNYLKSTREIHPTNLLYLKFSTGSDQRHYLKRKMRSAEIQDPMFLCVQGLDNARPETKKIFLKWLDQLVLL